MFDVGNYSDFSTSNISQTTYFNTSQNPDFQNPDFFSSQVTYFNTSQNPDFFSSQATYFNTSQNPDFFSSQATYINTSQNPDIRTSDPAVNILFYTLAVYIPVLFLSNAVVLVTFYLLPSLRTPDNYIIAFLALADLLIGVVVLPIVIAQVIDPEIFQRSYLLCLFNLPIRFTIFSVSVSMLTLLTIERCSSICYPFWYNSNVTTSEAKLAACLLVTIDIVIYNIVCSYAMLNMSEEKDGIINCTFPNLPNWFKKLMTIVLFVKILVGVCCTVKVARTLQNSLAKLRDVNYGFTQAKYKSMRSDARIIVILMFMFVILLAPSIAAPFFLNEDTDKRTSGIVLGIAFHLSNLNSCLNCVVYAVSRRVYRSAFMFFLTRRPWQWGEIRMELVGQIAQRSTGTKLTESQIVNFNKRKMFMKKLEDDPAGSSTMWGTSSYGLSSPSIIESMLDEAHGVSYMGKRKIGAGIKRISSFKKMYRLQESSVDPVVNDTNGTTYSSRKKSTVVGERNIRNTPVDPKRGNPQSSPSNNTSSSKWTLQMDEGERKKDKLCTSVDPYDHTSDGSPSSCWTDEEGCRDPTVSSGKRTSSFKTIHFKI